MSEYVLPAGDLDRRIDLMRTGAGDDGFSATEAAPMVLATVWAKVRPAQGRIASALERVAAGQVQALNALVFEVRWSATTSGVTAADSIRYPAGTGKTFDIRGLTEKGRRVAIEIVATERIA